MNDLIIESHGSRSGRLSFVATSKTRRLYAVCPKLLADEVARQQSFQSDGHVFPAFASISPDPSMAASATTLIGAFEFDYTQPFDLCSVPRTTISPFEALGQQLWFLGHGGGPHVRVELLNVALDVAGNGEMTGFMQLEPIDEGHRLPTDGGLLVDGSGRAVAILVGRSPSRYFAVGIQDVLASLRLQPAYEADLVDLTVGFNPDTTDPVGIGEESDKLISTGQAAPSHPDSQLAEIIGGHRLEPAYG